MKTALGTKQYERARLVKGELARLCQDLKNLNERALPIVEELENWTSENGGSFSWTPEVKAQFKAMRGLITKVGGYERVTLEELPARR